MSVPEHPLHFGPGTSVTSPSRYDGPNLKLLLSFPWPAFRGTDAEFKGSCLPGASRLSHEEQFGLRPLNCRIVGLSVEVAWPECQSKSILRRLGSITKRLPVHPTTRFSNQCCGKGLFSPLSSRPKRTRISCYTAPSDIRVCGFLLRKTAWSTLTPRISTGNPGERSGEICSFSIQPERPGRYLHPAHFSSAITDFLHNQSGTNPKTPKLQSMSRHGNGMPLNGPAISASGTTPAHAIMPKVNTHLFLTGST